MKEKGEGQGERRVKGDMRETRGEERDRGRGEGWKRGREMGERRVGEKRGK